MDREIVSIGSSQNEPFRLIWTNEQSERFRYIPNQFTVVASVARWRQLHPTLNAIRVDLPPAWVSDFPAWRPVAPHTSMVTWRVTANEAPRSFSEVITLTALSDAHSEISRLDRTVTIEIRAVSQFDPDEHVIRSPNSVDGWGIVRPSRPIFERTYGLTFWRNRFFHGLYRSVLFLGAESGQYQGGICTGLARVALERSLSTGAIDVSLDAIILWHGRQLADRALLASARWLFRSSPRRAFNAFSRDLMNDSKSSRCFDIDVPRPWRRDIVSALRQEGHTVVPYALKQSSRDRAQVSVYDPNDPEGSVQGSSVITFLLDEDSYRYSPLDGVDLTKTTIIAVEQTPYRNGRTALLASLANVMLSLEARLRAVWTSLRSSRDGRPISPAARWRR